MFTSMHKLFVIRGDIMEKLPREFYERSTLDVAKDLLGKHLVRVTDGLKRIGTIVEVEAYMGPEDKAAHSYNRRRTERNDVMYGPAGYAYVYIIYGMYACMNVITEGIDIPRGVLIRALEPIDGISEMAQSRFGKNYSDLKKSQIINLTSGPGKLCIAMGITKAHCNGEDLCGDNLYITKSITTDPFEIVSAKRINIDYAEEYIDYPWRFYIKGNPFVSKPHE
jgi:DNA-3-methyladenine glycosylase